MQSKGIQTRDFPGYTSVVGHIDTFSPNFVRIAPTTTEGGQPRVVRKGKKRIIDEDDEEKEEEGRMRKVAKTTESSRSNNRAKIEKNNRQLIKTSFAHAIDTSNIFVRKAIRNNNLVTAWSMLDFPFCDFDLWKTWALPVIRGEPIGIDGEVPKLKHGPKNRQERDRCVKWANEFMANERKMFMDTSAFVAGDWVDSTSKLQNMADKVQMLGKLLAPIGSQGTKGPESFDMLMPDIPAKYNVVFIIGPWGCGRKTLARTTLEERGFKVYSIGAGEGDRADLISTYTAWIVNGPCNTKKKRGDMPALIIQDLDEWTMPTSGDPAGDTRSLVGRLINALAKTSKIPVVITTSNPYKNRPVRNLFFAHKHIRIHEPCKETFSKVMNQIAFIAGINLAEMVDRERVQMLLEDFVKRRDVLTHDRKRDDMFKSFEHKINPDGSWWKEIKPALLKWVCLYQTKPNQDVALVTQLRLCETSGDILDQTPMIINTLYETSSACIPSAISTLLFYWDTRRIMPSLGMGSSVSIKRESDGDEHGYKKKLADIGRNLVPRLRCFSLLAGATSSCTTYINRSVTGHSWASVLLKRSQTRQYDNDAPLPPDDDREIAKGVSFLFDCYQDMYPEKCDDEKVAESLGERADLLSFWDCGSRWTETCGPIRKGMNLILSAGFKQINNDEIGNPEIDMDGTIPLRHTKFRIEDASMLRGKEPWNIGFRGAASIFHGVTDKKRVRDTMEKHANDACLRVCKRCEGEDSDETIPCLCHHVCASAKDKELLCKEHLFHASDTHYLDCAPAKHLFYEPEKVFLGKTETPHGGQAVLRIRHEIPYKDSHLHYEAFCREEKKRVKESTPRNSCLLNASVFMLAEEHPEYALDALCAYDPVQFHQSMYQSR